MSIKIVVDCEPLQGNRFSPVMVSTAATAKPTELKNHNKTT